MWVCECVHVCICMHVWLHVGMCTCVSMYGLYVGAQVCGYVCVPMHSEAGGQPCLSFLRYFHLYFWERVFHWPETCWGEQAGQLESPRDLPVLGSRVLGLQMCCHHVQLCKHFQGWVLKLELRLSFLHSNNPRDWAHPPVLELVFSLVLPWTEVLFWCSFILIFLVLTSNTFVLVQETFTPKSSCHPLGDFLKVTGPHSLYLNFSPPGNSLRRKVSLPHSISARPTLPCHPCMPGFCIWLLSCAPSIHFPVSLF